MCASTQVLTSDITAIAESTLTFDGSIYAADRLSDFTINS